MNHTMFTRVRDLLSIRVYSIGGDLLKTIFFGGGRVIYFSYINSKQIFGGFGDLRSVLGVSDHFPCPIRFRFYLYNGLWASHRRRWRYLASACAQSDHDGGDKSTQSLKTTPTNKYLRVHNPHETFISSRYKIIRRNRL